MYPEAIEEHAKADSLDGFSTPEEIEGYREIFRAAGWQGYIERRAADLEENSKKKYITPHSLANHHARASNGDQAFADLKQAMEGL